MAEEQQEVVSEEVTDVAPETEIQESSQNEPEGYTEAELKALDAGWQPKESFKGESGKWVDADEFNRRGELFGKMDVLSRELRESKKALKMLQDHHNRVRETEYKRAIDELKAEKKAAYEDGNVDRIVEVDDRIAEVKAAQQTERQAVQQQVNQPDPRFLQWVERNSWYAQDKELQAFADATGTAHAAQYPNKSPEDVLEYVTQRVKKAYSEKFVNPNRTKPSAVEGSSTKDTTGKRSAYNLSEDEARVMNTFVRQGIMTKEEYIDQLKKIKGDA